MRDVCPNGTLSSWKENRPKGSTISLENDRPNGTLSMGNDCSEGALSENECSNGSLSFSLEKDRSNALSLKNDCPSGHSSMGNLCSSWKGGGGVLTSGKDTLRTTRHPNSESLDCVVRHPEFG